MHEAKKPIDKSIIEPTLLTLPSQRVGYSDRTAWLMATMSQLAYFQFENTSNLEGIAEDLAVLTRKEETLVYLQSILAGLDKGDENDRQNILVEILNVANFELVRVFDVGSTQAFLARRKAKEGEPKMLVLAFRGTEQSIKDWKVNVKAELVPARDEYRIGRIHEGFQNAYYGVEDQIEKTLKKYPDEPLFITGHSLGGALAVVATRFLDAGSLAACYTFGCPRVGDLELAQIFKTPIYRLVNAADLVPRLPFGYGLLIFMKVFRWGMALLPTFGWLSRLYTYLDKIAGYTHYGDQRYLTATEPGANDTYSGLQLISNPSFFLLLERFWKRTKDSKGQGLIRDHSIGIYRAKLRARAIARNK